MITKFLNRKKIQLRGFLSFKLIKITLINAISNDADYIWSQSNELWIMISAIEHLLL